MHPIWCVFFTIVYIVLFIDVNKNLLIMSTNHQMNYYDYGKTLDIQGVMPVIGGGGKS